MSCVAGCPTCAPAKPACAARSRRSTPSSPTVSCTSNSPTTLTASSPSCATRPTFPASRSANACCGWSSKTSSSAPTRSPSVTASRSATPTPATPTPRPSPPRRATIARVIHCVGGVLSPLLSSLALSVLDEHIQEHGQVSAPPWVRERRRRQGRPNYRIVRYADDFAVLVACTRDDTQAVREQVAAVLATIGLRLSQEKTTICHIDEGFEFLGWRIQRHQQRGSLRRYVYTYPSVRHEAPLTERSCKGSAADLSQQAGEAEDSPILETQGRVGAVLTTTGRVGTARRPGSGKQGEKAYERNQRVRPRKRCAGSNLVDLGRSAVHARRMVGDSDAGTDGPARRPRGRAAAYSWRGCRGIAGRLPRPAVTGERGKRPRSPASGGQARRRLMALGRGGAFVVVRGRESRPH